MSERILLSEFVSGRLPELVGDYQKLFDDDFCSGLSAKFINEARASVGQKIASLIQTENQGENVWEFVQ